MEVPNANVYSRVFFIRRGDKVGTAFTIDVDGKQYLITAEHLEFDDTKDDTYIYLKGKWRKVEYKIIKCNPGIDIVILALPSQLSHTLKLPPESGKIILGQNVFIIGYPLSMYVTIKNVYGDRPFPFIKKGIISAIDCENPEKQTIYLDIVNNSGFSGGPMVAYEYPSKTLKVIGVVSGYKFYVDTVYEGEEKTDKWIKNNSGITVGYSIKHAVDAIKSNPIGPLITNPT